MIEDDPDVREQLDELLLHEGYRIESAQTGAAALELVESKFIRPDLILVNYNPRGKMNGLEVRTMLWGALHYQPPTVMLTGEISPAALRSIALQKCLHMKKPIRPFELSRAIQRLLEGRSPMQTRRREEDPSTICIVEDNRVVRSALGVLLTQSGYNVGLFDSAESYLASAKPQGEFCLLVDASLPGMSGLKLMQSLQASGNNIPAVMMAGNSNVHLAVESMKAGAIDFLEMPVGNAELLACMRLAIEHSRKLRKWETLHDDAVRHMKSVTPRQRQIMTMVLSGNPSKNIASDLGISQRTVENHRAAIMKRTGAKSLPALERLAVAASANELALGPTHPASRLPRHLSNATADESLSIIRT